MNNWEKEALFVLELQQEDDRVLFRDCDPTAREEHDKFVDKYGFSYNDIWDLDRQIAMFILPRLAYFREKANGIPDVMETDADVQAADQDVALQKWDDVMKTICDGLHLYLENNSDPLSESEKALWVKAKQYLFEYFEWFWD